MSSSVRALVAGLLNDPIAGHAANGSATGLLLFTLLGWLTPILSALAVILSIVVYGITIYESKTFKGFSIRFRSHLARVLKSRGHATSGDALAKSALADAKAVVVLAQADVVVAKDTVADAKQAVAAPVTPAVVPPPAKS